jgi:hypothetical protein
VALALAFGLASAAPCRAVVGRLVPLREVIAVSPVIVTARVESFDPDRPAMVLVVGEALKGKPVFTRVPVALRGDTEAARAGQVPQLLRRLAPRQELVVFVYARGESCTAFGYANGTWFQMTGVKSDGQPRWAFTHFEPYLRQTFKGTTDEMREVIEGVLAGKRKAPEPDPKEKPGLGPEVGK